MKSGTRHKKRTGGIGIIKKRVIFLIGLLIVIVVILIYFLRDLPNPTKLASNEYPESSQVYDRNGKLLYEFFSDKRRTEVKLNSIPKEMINATLAIEDANFYNHGGFDFKGIVRGLFRTFIERRLQGGSTLTQQLVKNALLSPERTWTRKIKEAILTIATEMLYSKNQILEMYFNQIPYGGTIWGAEAAAKGIFNKNVADLTLPEAALIAGLPGSPTSYSPFSHPDAAKVRQQLVLKRMTELGMITETERSTADKTPLVYSLNKGSIEAPHFVFYVKEKLIDEYGINKVNEGGLKITTTLDLDLQNYVQEVIVTEIAKLTKMKVGNGAALVTDPKSGQILAMVGSKDYFSTDIDGKFNITTAMRQPGSSIKPINYAVGIETGKITAASVFDDEPTCFLVENQKPYCPTNYGNAYHGIQTTRNALGNSLNIPAVKMLRLNGVENFVASASAIGLRTLKNPANYGLSLTLGGGEVQMVDMNVAFGALANTGVRQDLISILKVIDKNGKVLEENKYVQGNRVMSRETSFIISQILADDGARSMVFGSGSMLNIKKHPEVSVKTGTTNDMRDNWTIGYTPDYVATVWVGNNDNSRMGGLVSGTTGAAPIWNKIMTKILEGKTVKKQVMPATVVGINVCNLTGQLPPDEGCASHYEYFKKEFVPTQKVSLKQSVLIDKDTGRMVLEGETKPNAEWQDHNVIRDAVGVMVCLDCPLINEADKVSITIN